MTKSAGSHNAKKLVEGGTLTHLVEGPQFQVPANRDNQKSSIEAKLAYKETKHDEAGALVRRLWGEVSQTKFDGGLPRYCTSLLPWACP